MATAKRITLRDVAELAKVSTGTVSMVLNQNPVVAEETRKHVMRVIRKSGYVYDRNAAQLRKKRSSIVGGAICNLLNPYFAEVAAGMEAGLAAAGQRLVLGNAAEDVARQERFLDTLREHNVEGLLWMPAIGTRADDVKRVIAWGTPIVMVSRYVDDVDVDAIGPDNQLAASLATRHLAELGHRKIAFIGADRRISSGRDRLAGYRSAMAKAKLTVARGYEVDCPSTREAGFAAVRALMDGADPPSAVVGYNDLVAFGAMLGLRKLGLEPGRDCSVVGIDDSAEAALWVPMLTTVSIDTEGIGRGAVPLLAQRIAEPEAPTRRIAITPRLVVRESSCELEARGVGTARGKPAARR